ncbi:MAG: universal stress protein [Pseudohongiellaceae bacterium]|nr:universal stress protein [Pseudohongiellaceae bacterium]
MSTYNKLLVAIDLSNESDKIIQRAKRLVDGNADKITLIHIVEPVAAAYPIDAYAIDMTAMQEEAVATSKKRLADIGASFGISEANQLAIVGAASTEIRAQAESLGCDLIVIGSHGRSGWKLLLGSTANKVLHGANCDILTVRVGE